MNNAALGSVAGAGHAMSDGADVVCQNLVRLLLQLGNGVKLAAAYMSTA